MGSREKKRMEKAVTLKLDARGTTSFVQQEMATEMGKIVNGNDSGILYDEGDKKDRSKGNGMVRTECLRDVGAGGSDPISRG
jgi:hypothetical protein